MSNEPIPVTLALRAVERETTTFGQQIGCCSNCSLARAGFRASLEFVRHQLSMFASAAAQGPLRAGSSFVAIGPEFGRLRDAVAPLIEHFDATALRLRTTLIG